MRRGTEGEDVMLERSFEASAISPLLEMGAYEALWEGPEPVTPGTSGRRSRTSLSVSM